MTIDAASITNTEIFQATYPKYLERSLIQKIISVVYFIFSILFLPLGLCRIIAYKLHVNIGYYFFVPSQFLSKKQTQYLDVGRKHLENDFEAQEITIKTADGVKLNGMFVLGKDQYGQTLSDSGPLIIHFLGNAGRYEDLGFYQDAITNVSDHNFLIVNYRGVSKSESIATRRGLLLDIEAMLQYAIEKLHVPKRKIILHGHSFGGCLATILASHHRGLRLLNDRSFSSLEKAVYHIVKKIFYTAFSYSLIMPFVLIEKVAPQKVIDSVDRFVKKHRIFIDGKLLRPTLIAKIILFISKLIALFFSKFTVFLGWDFNPSFAWKKIKSKKCIILLRKDEIIPFDASFFKAVKKTKYQFVRVMDRDCLHWTIIPKAITQKIIEDLT